MKAGARGTAGSAVAPPTRRQPLANAPALAGLARGLMGACQPTNLEEDLRRTRIDEQKVEKRAITLRGHDAVTLRDDCVGILALLQGTIKLRRSAAARRLTASQSPGPHWTLLDPPCCPSLPTGNQCPVGSTHPPQPARGVPRVRDPEVVEGPTRPICPPSDPVSCLPHPRDVVPAPLPYQDITHRTRNRLTTPLRVAGELPSPLL